MFLSIIKDLHDVMTNFLQTISTTATTVNEYYLDWKLSLSRILPMFPSDESIDNGSNTLLFIGKTIFFLLLQVQHFLVYFFSFKWLALSNFAYLNVLVPENFFQSFPKIPPVYEYSSQLFLNLQAGTRFWNMLLDKLWFPSVSKIYFYKPFFLEGYSSIHYPPNLDKTNLSFSDYYKMISNLPNILLDSSWFDSISTPMQIFGTPYGVEYDQWHRATNNSGFFDNLGFFGFWFFPILIGIFFSSFFNSFFINFPLTISKIVSLRYFNVASPYYKSTLGEWRLSQSKKKNFSFFENFEISILSVFGIVLGEMCFILLLILPPPFIQLTLSYLDSIFPYVIGLILISYIISHGMKTNLVTLWTTHDSKTAFLNIQKKPLRVFLSCFLLSLTEQSCCFSYFGSLNLNVTANFFDTYIFSASGEPMILIFSCLGFFIGSFFAIIIYNFCFSQLLYFLFFGWYHKKKILSFIFPSYAAFRYKVIKWWNSPNRNLKSPVSEFLLFISQSYKFLNFFSVINSSFSKIFTLLINKTTQNIHGMEKSKKTDYYSFNLSAYFKNQQILSNKIKSFPKVFQQNRISNWFILNGIDKFLTICLITFSFTTIPYYSIDYMVKNFSGFIPQDQILNTYNLHNAYNDYGQRIGAEKEILDENTNTMVTHYSLLHEIALYDDNNYDNGLWKVNFEELNYRHELQFSSFKQQYQEKKRRKFFGPTMKRLRNRLFPYYETLKNNSVNYGNLIKDFKLFLAKKNIFIVDPKDFLNDTLRKKNIKNFEEAFSVISSKVLNCEPDGFSRCSRYWGPRKKINNPLKAMTYANFDTIQFDTLEEDFMVLSGISIPKLKQRFAYKYFHNPISQIILSNDVKNFLKHQPLSQQLTDVQEKDLALLKVKMAHYYDSLRFYFDLKSQVHELKESFNNVDYKNSRHHHSIDKNTTKKLPTHKSKKITPFYKNLKFPPIIAKSISSLNYQQQFKGTYDVVRELYDISLYKNKINNNTIFPQESPKSENFAMSSVKKQDNDNELFLSENTSENFDSTAIKKNDNKNKPFLSKNIAEMFDFIPKEYNRDELLFDKDTPRPFGSVVLEDVYPKGWFNNKFIRKLPITYDPEKSPVRQRFEIRIATIASSCFNSVTSRVKNFTDTINNFGNLDDVITVNNSKKLLQSNDWLPDRKALLSYDKSLFNEYDYQEENFLHEEAKIMKDNANFDNHSNLITSQEKKKKNLSQTLNSNQSFDQPSDKNLMDFIKMNKTIKDSFNPFYVGWDQQLRKFILTSRIIHRPFYLSQQKEDHENLQPIENKSDSNHGKLSKVKKIIHSGFDKIRQKISPQFKYLVKNFSHSSDSNSKPKLTQYYSSWPYMGDKITSLKSNKYSGLYIPRRMISDNPRTETNKNLRTYYYGDFRYYFYPLFGYQILDDLPDVYDYYYHKNSFSLSQVFPRLYMPNNYFKLFIAENYKKTLFSPTASTFLWPGNEDIYSNYSLHLLDTLRNKFLGLESNTLSLPEKMKQRETYRKSYLIKGKKRLTPFDAMKHYFPNTFYKFKNYQNHILRNYDLDKKIEELLYLNQEVLFDSNNIDSIFFFTEHTYPQETEEDLFQFPNFKYPESLQYTNREVRILKRGHDNGVIKPTDNQMPEIIERTEIPNESI